MFVSLGIFSIIKIERHVQLLIPSYDFRIPQKECVGATDDNPCDLFEKMCIRDSDKSVCKMEVYLIKFRMPYKVK